MMNTGEKNETLVVVWEPSQALWTANSLELHFSRDPMENSWQKKVTYYICQQNILATIQFLCKASANSEEMKRVGHSETPFTSMPLWLACSLFSLASLLAYLAVTSNV